MAASSPYRKKRETASRKRSSPRAALFRFLFDRSAIALDHIEVAEPVNATHTSKPGASLMTEPALFDNASLDQPAKKKKQGVTIMNTHQALDIVTSIIDEQELDHGNGEAYIIDDTDALYVSVEAPNNATVGDIIPITATTIRRDIVNALRDMMWRFDADDEFDELYSPEFMHHNGFTPSRFLNMLTEDQKYFEHVADRLNNARTIADTIA
ncbi:hypothetical protein [Bifidobacterium aquikefiri]|uniref:hypothetical protein n=1 Tax=Bifidobacterium aquikefiri TaxID=1653207 RepID=UPI0039E96B72